MINYLTTHPIVVSIILSLVVVYYYVKEVIDLHSVYEYDSKQNVKWVTDFIRDNLGLLIQYAAYIVVIWNRCLLFDILF